MIKKMKDCSLWEKIAFWLFKFICCHTYDKYGLRYSANILSEIHKVQYRYPIEFLASFHDIICAARVLGDQITFERYKSDGYTIPPQYGCDFKNMENFHYNHANAVSIGNMAYIALNHPVEEIRDKAYSLLDESFQVHIARLNSSN